MSASLSVPVATGSSIKFTITPTPKGAELYYTSSNLFPVTLAFIANFTSPGAVFSWDFGDGTNATGLTVSHTYSEACIYEVRLVVTNSTGVIATGSLVMGLFGVRTKSGGDLAICPPEGTATLIPVEVAGGYFNVSQRLGLLLNGSPIATVTADHGGLWFTDVTPFIGLARNGTKYIFTTSPPTVTRTFVTVEGIRATPTSGGPGTSVVVEGRSYNPYTSVEVYLQGVYLGTGQTDDVGSFTSTFQIPFTSPLTSAGTYAYTTIPPILGSQANFRDTGGIGSLIPCWLWWILIIIAIIIIVYYWRRRRLKRLRALQARAIPTQA